MEKPKPQTEWADSVGSIVAMGKFLEEAKSHLDHQEFVKKAYADFGISESSNNKIIRISTHPILSNPEYADRLPSAWGTLYEMKFLPDELLLEKINNGEARYATKYKVWEWRGVKTKKPDGYIPKNPGPYVRVPDNISLAAYVSAGMNKEPEFNNSAEEVSKYLGIGTATYRQIRQVILLSRHPDLSDADEKFVQSLIDKINKTRNVREYYQKAKPLIEKIWGKTVGQPRTTKLHAKRVEAYLNSVFLLGVSAQRLADMEAPYMSVENTDKAIVELAEAGTIIRKTAEKLRRTKND